MEINAQEVIDKLSRKLAKAEAEKAVLEVQVDVLQAENASLAARVPKDNEVVGEVIG